MRELTNIEIDLVAGGTDEPEPEIIVTGNRPAKIKAEDLGYISPDIPIVSGPGLGR